MDTNSDSQLDTSLEAMLSYKTQSSFGEDTNASTETPEAGREFEPTTPSQTPDTQQDEQSTQYNTLDSLLDQLGPDPRRSRDKDATSTADQQPAQQQQQQSSGHTEDLVLSNGAVVKGGQERQFFEAAQHWHQQATQLHQQATQQLQQLQHAVQQKEAELQGYREAAQASSHYGLQPAEATMAAQLMAGFKRDPVGTLKYMLAEAKARGYNVDGIGGDVNTAAIQSTLREALSPIVQERQAAQAEQQRYQQAYAETQALYAKFPHAEMHQDVLAELIHMQPHLSLTEAYYELQLAVTQAGLRLDQPLRPQIAAAAQRLQQQQASAAASAHPQPTSRTRETIPGGRPGATGLSERASIADADDPWDEIVRAAMSS